MQCHICDGPTQEMFVIRGGFRPRDFCLRRCSGCGFCFVANPLTDYASLYDEAYYHGQGADPWIDYVFELEQPTRTVRRSEWRGILEAVTHLAPLTPQTKWLDYGCGNGGQVRYVREHSDVQISGYETGWIAGQAVKMGIPMLGEEELTARENSFDVVTAIEVFEHLVDPKTAVRQIRRLLKPGGLFFFTTGNVAPFRARLAEWGYFLPELHVSYYEPRTLEKLLVDNGFRAEYHGFLPGFQSIYRFKVLKGLKVRRGRWYHDVLPWRGVARWLDRRRQLTAHPIGRAA